MADESKLSDLHDKVAEVLIDALDGQEIPEIVDEDGVVIQERTKMPVSAAHVTAAIQFLKNNNITCVPSEDNKLGELEAAMKARKEKRAKRLQPTRADLAAAAHDMDFLGGKLGNC